MNNEENIRIVYFYFYYVAVRAYWFNKNKGAPIKARTYLPVIIGGLLIFLKRFFKMSSWLIIVPAILTLLYGLKGIHDEKKGKLPHDKQNINYDKLLIEFLITLLVSLLIVKLLGLNYFVEGF